MGPRSGKPSLVTKICDNEKEAGKHSLPARWLLCVMVSHLSNQSYFWKSSTLCISLALPLPALPQPPAWLTPNHSSLLLKYCLLSGVCCVGLLLTSELLVNCTCCGWGPSPPEQRRGAVARVTAAGYKATHALDGRSGGLVLIFIMKGAMGSCSAWYGYKMAKRRIWK